MSRCAYYGQKRIVISSFEAISLTSFSFPIIAHYHIEPLSCLSSASSPYSMHVTNSGRELTTPCAIDSIEGVRSTTNKPYNAWMRWGFAPGITTYDAIEWI